MSTTWLTPPPILRAVTQLVGFDLDPCACPDPRPWPTARTHWVIEDEPLRRDWFGRVWLNPPFGPKATVLAFMRKMAVHNHGIALLFARTETELFFECVWGRASALLFMKGRPHFHRYDGSRAEANSGAPVVLIAYGVEDAARLRACGLPGAFIDDSLRLTPPANPA
jgi:hypothetical protein